ncbi:unnamed protein product [Cuscuta epithymum]|uniref:40S ribosomal protein S17 n=2 Tax=Cuscuta epithymum TaxID=186058 RepID=A0AAV0CQ00_9ASTE|nr:unnamed protein product [Cuscuta epithymum]
MSIIPKQNPTRAVLFAQALFVLYLPLSSFFNLHGRTLSSTATMGRVRTKTVKKSSRQVIERYYSRLTLDFHTNKKVLQEVAVIPTKRLRNKIAGFSTHLMKRIQKGPVRGISLKLQEEERERRMDFVPEESAINTERIEVDKETIELLTSLGMAELPGVVVKEEESGAMAVPGFAGGRGGFAGGRGGFGGGGRY